MGRRLAGGALVAIGLVAASLAWAGYSISNTVLDASRSRAIADEVYDDPEVRAQLRSAMAGALDAAIPESVPISRVEIAAAADRALHDPAVEAAVVGGLVRAHQRFLGQDPNPDEPIVVDAAALAAATRSELVNAHPDLLGAVPEVPSIAVTLPTDSIPDAGGARGTIMGAVVFLCLVAVGLVVAAMVVTDSRARILRRVGFWAIGAAAFWLLVGVVVPSLAHLVLPGQAAIIAAIWGVAAGSMLEPSITLALAGAVALALSIVWSVASSLADRRSRAARRPDPRRERLRTAASPSPAPAAPAATYYGPSRPSRLPPDGRPVSAPSAARSAPARPAPASPAADPTSVARSPLTPTPRPAPRWVEGVGYVDDPDATSIN